MGWYALEELDEAFEETKDLLLPFEKGKWLRLLVISIFIGGMGFNFYFPGFPGGDYDPSYDTQTDFSSPASSMAVAAPVAAFAVVLGLAILAFAVLFFVLSSIFEFIFYQSLLDKNVRIRPNFREHFWKGLHYFGFNAGMLLIGLLYLGIVVLGFMANIFLGVLLLLAGIPVALAVAVIMNLTQNFVLLEMIEKDQGIIQSWKSFYSTLREQWRQVAVFLVVKFALGIAVGILAFTAFLALFIPLLVVLGVPAILLAMIHPVLTLIPLIAGTAIFGAAMLVFKAAVSTYLYYFSILVYHDLSS